MNITILANRDLASNIALNYLVKGLSKHKLNIFLSDQVGSQLDKPAQLIELQFFEQHLFNKLLFPALDLNGSKADIAESNALKIPPSNTDIDLTIAKNRSQLLTFHQLEQAIGSSLESLNDINQVDGLRRLSSTAPDLILSVRYGKILQEKAIAVPKLGVLNLHSGLLPQYQGVMATFWAMFNEEDIYGTTLHFIDSNAIDSGPIISFSQDSLDLTKSYLTNVLALYELGCGNMIAAVHDLDVGTRLQPKPQDGNSQYFSFPSKTQLDDFNARGMRLFDTIEILELAQSYRPSLSSSPKR